MFLKPEKMKKVIYALFLPLFVVSVLVFAGCQMKNDASEKPAPKQFSAAETKAAREAWEATPEGQKYKQWESSHAGMKVFTGEANIKKYISNFTNMEAVVTSLTLPPGSRLGFGVMARIDGVDYIVKFEPEQAQLAPLQRLKVGDKIIIRSRTVSHAPKYAYPIVTGDEVEQDGKMIYKRIIRNGGC
jgi:hypothetical protein